MFYFEFLDENRWFTVPTLSVSTHSDILQELGSVDWVEGVLGDTLGRHEVPAAVGVLQGHAAAAGGRHVAALQGQAQHCSAGRHHHPPLAPRPAGGDLDAEHRVPVLQHLQLLHQYWLHRCPHCSRSAVGVHNLQYLTLDNKVWI